MQILQAGAGTWGYRAVRCALGLIFLFAGGVKLLDLEAFEVLIAAFGIVPDPLLETVAVGLPVFEVLGAIGLLLDVRGALALVAGLLVVFMAILGYGIWMGLDVDCGCFGPGDLESRAYHGLRAALLRDLVLLAGVFTLYTLRFLRRCSPLRLAELMSIVRKGEARMGKTMIGWLAVVGLALGSWGIAGAEDRFEQELKIEQTAVALVNQVASGGYRLIDTGTLRQWIDAKKDMVLVDTMPYEDSYRKEHIPGAKQFLFPIPEMKTWDAKETDGKTREDFAKLLGADKNKPVVFYCGFVKCTRSHNGAAWAVKLGYTDVYRQPGGVFAWKGAGYPVESAK